MNARQQEYYAQIKSVVESKGGQVISDRYEKMVNKMVFQCQNKHQWDTEARSILKGMWCRYCHGNAREQGEENFKQRVADKGGKILGKYLGNHTKVNVQCKFGHEWEILPYNLASGKWCPVCGYKNHGGGSTRFVRTVADRGGKVIEDYINSKTRIKVQCNKGHIWNPKPYYIVTGNWCPFCTGSSGENVISLYLSEKGINYKPQSTIVGLSRKRFDFLIEHNGQNIVIEYDGEMHFRYIPYYHVNMKFFLYRQSVDRVKTLSAITNGYKVIRIDYSQLLNIRYHLDIALDQLNILYLSTPKLYEGWLSGSIVSNEEIKSVIDGRSRPDYYEDNPVNVVSNGLSLVVIK